MRRQILVVALAASTALGFAAAPVTRAAAQGYPSYCDGRLQSLSFYTTLNATSSTASYFLILQNRTSNQVSFAVAFNNYQLTHRPSGMQLRELSAWSTSQPILLGNQQVDNPSGSGALSVSGLLPDTQVICR